MYHKTKPYRIFTVFNYILMIAVSVMCVVPLIHVLAVSFSGKSAANANLVGLWPVDFTVDAYTKTVANENFIRSIWVTLQRTVLGTLFSMGIVILAAYALSKENARFRRRNMYIWLLVFTMLFSGGLVPMYILIQKLHLMNSIWVLILPGAVSVWNVILLLNFFRAVPKEWKKPPSSTAQVISEHCSACISRYPCRPLLRCRCSRLSVTGTPGSTACCI